jgi:hypothetical protein
MDSWAAIVTLPGMEFVACQEIRRFCLTCFLPQRRRRIFLKGAAESFMYAMPLIPRRALMPLRQARSRELHYARGVKGPKFLVDGPDGKLFTVPDAAVWTLCDLDRAGAFDDPPPGNAVRLTGCELLAAIAGETLANLFAPLFPAPAPRVPRTPTKAELLEAGRPSPDLRVSPWVSPLSAAASRDVREREELAQTIGRAGSVARTRRRPGQPPSRLSRSNGATPSDRGRRAPSP